MSKMHMLFSEKEKLEKEYLQWCEKANKEIHGGRIDDKSFITVISFLQSIGWGNIKELESENVELRARLDKAVELKAKVGDTIYMPWKYDGNDGISTLRIFMIHFGHNGELLYTTNLKSDDDLYFAIYKYGIFRNEDFDNIVFINRAEAESRFAELNGDN